MQSIGKIGKFEQRKAVKPKIDIHLHSPAHMLADELSVRLNDRRHFAIYLGMAVKYDHNFLRKIMGEVLEARDVKFPGKLFAFLVKKHNQEIRKLGN